MKSVIAAQSSLGLRDHLTHKANLRHTRYGWLRLTPAYSVHLVTELLEAQRQNNPIVLDPFCGTGTTALVCAERGLQVDTTDINPFLVWLAGSKCRKYAVEELEAFRAVSPLLVESIKLAEGKKCWTPPLHQIEKWWDAKTLKLLSYLLTHINELAATIPVATLDLLKIAFCRTLIERANVSFGHQSMSFKQNANGLLFDDPALDVVNTWQAVCQDILQAASSVVLTEPRVLLCDARKLSQHLPHDYYTCVITSPPYPNRMSYIRELRPYMYWLGYLQDGRAAGELDWEAIGGTWGCATSNVGKWSPPVDRELGHPAFTNLLSRIAAHSPLLSRYVHKYFYDMVEHVGELFTVVCPGGVVNYIVGNSKFYDVLVPVEELFAALFKSAGFQRIKLKTIRKRTSKKELFEFIVSAVKP